MTGRTVQFPNKGSKTSFILLAAWLCFSPLTVSMAQSPSPSADAQSQTDELVMLIVAPEMQAKQALVQADTNFMRTASADANLQKLEQKRPGLIAAMRTALRIELQNQIPAMTKTMVSQLSYFFQSNFTQQEIQTLLDFYRSPAGIRMTASAQKAGVSQVNSAISDRKIDSTDLQHISNHAAAAAAHAIEPGDIEALAKFSQTTASQKILQVQGQLNSALLAIINTESTRIQSLINARLQSTIKAHLAKH